MVKYLKKVRLEEGFFGWMQPIRRKKIRKKFAGEIEFVFVEVGGVKNLRV
jgi:hypothetical protein